MAAFLFLHLFCMYLHIYIYIYIYKQERGENVLFFSLVALTLKKDGA